MINSTHFGGVLVVWVLLVVEKRRFKDSRFA